MMKYRLIIFDLGGVLIEYNEPEYYAYLSSKYNLSLRRVQKTFESLSPAFETGKMTLVSFETLAAKELGLKPSQLEWSYAFKRLASKNRHVEALIKRLRKKYKVALLTNNNRSRYEIAAAKFFDPKIFDRTFVSCLMGMRKPSASIYRRVLSEMGVKASETVFVDNMEKNVTGANRVGIRGIMYTNYTRLENELRRIGVAE